MDDEATLVSVGQERDPLAFERLCRSYAPRLLSFFRARAVPDPEAATQEVLLKVWRAAGTFDASRGSVSTWLFTIARNRAIDAHRKRRRPTPDPGDPAFVAASGGDRSPLAPDQATERARQNAELARAVDELTTKQREVVELVYWEGLTFTEVAERLGVPSGTAKSRFRLAMAALRKRLEETPDDA